MKWGLEDLRGPAFRLYTRCLCTPGRIPAAAGAEREQLLALALQAAVVGQMEMNRERNEERHRRPRQPGLLELPLDLARLVGLQHVALLDVLEVLDRDPALEALLDFTHVVLEALQRRDV